VDCPTELKTCTTYRDVLEVPDETATPEDVALVMTCRESDADTVIDNVFDASLVAPAALVIAPANT